MKKGAILLGLGLWLTACTVWASIPKLINFQGILRNPDGTLVADSTYSVIFKIYDAANAGNMLWTETQSVITSNGLFNVLLGSSTPVPESLFKDSSRYLAITVGSDQEMTPRQLLSSVGYSFNTVGTVPIGGLIAWLKSFPNTPALPGNFVECNGQVLNDPESIFNGQTIPDLNGVSGAKRFLRGSTTSGTIGGSSTHAHLLQTATDPIITGTNALHVTNTFTTANSHLPDYYEVVWIMRVK